MDPNLFVIAACFIGGVASFLAVYSLFSDFSEKSADKKSKNEIDFNAEAVRARATVQSETEPFEIRLKLWIAQSGLQIQLSAIMIASILVGCIPAAATYYFLRLWWLALIVYLIIALIPWAIVAIARNHRSNKLLEQLPDALDLMSRMMRAGQTIPQALRGVSEEFESPIADEFGYCYEQQNLGLSTDASMYEMARRTGVLELRILVVALTVHRQSGGNLSELLDNLAGVIRDRHRIRGQIKALTADGRMQAAILLALPPFLLIVLALINQEYIMTLFEFPWLLVGMFGFELLGAIWLRQIVSFDF